VLERFCEFSGKSPARLLAVARTPKGRFEILRMLERWIESLEGTTSTKLNYISTVRRYFDDLAGPPGIEPGTPGSPPCR
jgi:hypothetical protein